jgi:hypothetical protein
VDVIDFAFAISEDLLDCLLLLKVVYLFLDLFLASIDKRLAVHEEEG